MINDLRESHLLAYRKRTVRSTMLHVMAALVPGTLLYLQLLDSRILMNIAVAYLVALCCEYVCLHLRAKPVLASLSDGSTLLGVWLLVLCLPPSLPLWQIAMGSFVLVTLGKHVFGGLGHNPFNPAMVAYAFLLISFPVTMTSWELNQLNSDSLTPATETTENLEITVGLPAIVDNWDGLSGATALDRLRALQRSSQFKDSSTAHVSPANNEQPVTNPLFNSRHELSYEWIMNSAWMWISLAWLLGGLYLLKINIITWHTPASILVSVSGFYAIANLTGLEMALPILPALMSGGIVLGAFFVATDPVSAAASRQGQIIYGFGIGILTVVIREFSVYPEGFAFAVLLMNMCVPLIDHMSTAKTAAINSGNQRK